LAGSHDEGGTLNQIIAHESDDACAELTRLSIHITNTTAGEYLQCSGQRRDGTGFRSVSLGNFVQDDSRC
jgi:hypothetical protein